MPGGDYGIDVPAGDPGQLKSAAADLRGASGAMDSVSNSIAGNASIPGWTGAASFQYADQCVTQDAVVRSAASTLDAAARCLAELADELRSATHRAKAAVARAREADARLTSARADAGAARGRAGSASQRGDLAQQHAMLSAAHGVPSPALQADADAAFAESAQASRDAEAADRRARDAEHDLADAKRDGQKIVADYDAYANTAASVIGGLSSIAPQVVMPAPPPDPATYGVDNEHGGALSGLWKGLGDVKDEAVGLGVGAFHHVNVFDPDQLGDTWSGDWDTTKTLVSHPIESGKTIWNETTLPIRESWHTGGLDEAIGRGVPGVVAMVVGGKGLTKLGKLGKAGDIGKVAEDSTIAPGSKLYRYYGDGEDHLGTVPPEKLSDGTDVYSGAGPYGRSWTPVNPEDLKDPRSQLGLPSGGVGNNPARFLIEANVIDPSGMKLRAALPLDGHPGGAPEVVVPNPREQLEFVRVHGVNPEP